jgi:hypothetical protein
MAIQQNKAFFVSPEYILQMYAGYLDNNIDPNTLNSFILIAQNENTQQLLGLTLYQKFITDITSGYINDPADVNYKYLLDNYLMDSVALWTIWYAIDTIHLRITNKSIETKNSPNSQAIQPKELNRLKYLIMERAQFADARVRQQIINYPYDYPEYYQVTGVMSLVPKTNPYDNFFMTGKAFNRGGSGFPQGSPCNGCGGYLPGVGMSIWGT